MRARATIAIAAAGALGLAALAYGGVRIYGNDFSTRADAKEIRVGGKGCDKRYLDEDERLAVTAANGPTACRLKPPVQGDSPQPDHDVEVLTKVDKETPSSIRREVYVSVALRDGKGGRYELRVFPQRAGRKAFELTRQPGGGDFEVPDAEPKIGKVGERNRLRLRAFGDQVTAWINGTKIGPIADAAPEDLEGRRIYVALGTEAESGKEASGWIDDLEVGIPPP